MANQFTLYRRNPYHWDVNTSLTRLFRIRGQPGNVILYDERPESPEPVRTFRSIQTCMSYICDELMGEPQ